jgi:hypothetical protein
MYEQLRRDYMPEKITALFIGESRPKNGTFFYSENSYLFKHTQAAFAHVTQRPFNCKRFRAYGCWLYDVCAEPTNGLGGPARMEAVEKGLPRLRETLAAAAPEYVVIIGGEDFADLVFPCVEQAGHVDKKTAFLLPFPAAGQQKKYVQRLTSMLNRTLFQEKGNP